MAFKVLGIIIREFPQNGNGEFAILKVFSPISEVNSEKFKQRGLGYTTDVPYQKEEIVIDLEYAKKLMLTKAFVPDREYDFKRAEDPNSAYDLKVVELIPVDDEIKKHFAASMNNK